LAKKVQTKLEVVEDHSRHINLKVENMSEEIIQAIGDHILDLATTNLEMFNKIDTGMLMNSGKVEKVESGVNVVFDAPYAKNVEFGRDPGIMPPVEEIQRWAERRGIIERRGKGKRGSPTGVGYAIAKKIQRDGIKETPFLRDAVTVAKNDISKIIKQFKGGK